MLHQPGPTVFGEPLLVRGIPKAAHQVTNRCTPRPNASRADRVFSVDQPIVVVTRAERPTVATHTRMDTARGTGID